MSVTCGTLYGLCENCEFTKVIGKAIRSFYKNVVDLVRFNSKVNACQKGVHVGLEWTQMHGCLFNPWELVDLCDSSRT